ncbi:dihydropteroate synthase [Sulfitobacter sp. SK012]|uniref:dihydropteroate synthase n=1 Tax=Sulfitobacter sp. SK012 TaxID=1389005 RepID=UPI000E0C53ED|nr:dihydropteroate synthase [Sulfitobacter sp. SK012]AXI47367.1 dihydropteroate synthase [Sulfitobacter sp. SK012]
MDRVYVRPIVQVDVSRPSDAQTLGGGWGWFTHVELLRRDAAPEIVAADTLDPKELAQLTAPRGPIAGLSLERPRIMGILNTTPDSFSDGGQHEGAERAVAGALAMLEAGADMIDVGGESTRPGAETVDPDVEIRRTAPIIAELRAAGTKAGISIDTRKATAAQAALDAGANLINDVSGFTYDAELASLAARSGAPVCVMHAHGDPATMQKDPQYGDVLLDVYDFLEGQIAVLEDAGVARSLIVADPGIGFGKTQAHNLTLLARLSLYHSLGVPLLLGASRKRFIGTISGAEVADQRAPGSIAVALAGISQGVQFVRVHDVGQTKQAISLWQASIKGRV